MEKIRFIMNKLLNNLIDSSESLLSMMNVKVYLNKFKSVNSFYPFNVPANRITILDCL